MKKTLLFVLALIAVGSVELEAQQTIDLSELITEGLSPGAVGLYLDRRTLEPYTGPVLELHENGQTVKTRGTLRDGKWDGELTTYHESGQALSYRNYKKGLQHGPFRSWTWFGNVVSYGNHENGRLHGPYAFFGSEGMSLVEGGEYNMGTRCGEWRSGSAYSGKTVTHDPCPPDLEDGN